MFLKPRNKTLYNKVKKFTSASVTLLTKLALNETLPVLPDFYATEGSKVDCFLFIFKHSKDLENLPEFADCAEYILKNPVTRKATGWRDKDGNPPRNLPIDLSHFRILYVFLGTYIKEVGAFVFEKEIFEKLYAKFERDIIYSSHSLHRLSAPLEGLTGDIKEINFGNNFRIKHITEKEKTSYLSQFSMPLGPPIPYTYTDMAQIDFLLEAIHSQPKGKPLNTPYIHEGFKDIISVLRLFKQGYVDFTFIKSEVTTWSLQAGTGYAWRGSRQGGIFSSAYTLNEPEKPALLSLWRKFGKFKETVGASANAKYINLALKRFNFGVEENDFENKMIDFFVAFEALCLPERDELSYRLSNRVAVVIGKDSKEAEKIRGFITKAYEVRSRIVHGAEIKSIAVEGKVVLLNDFARRIEEYLRLMLKSFLAFSVKYGKQKEIIALIDKSLLDIETRKRIQAWAALS